MNSDNNNHMPSNAEIVGILTTLTSAWNNEIPPLIKRVAALEAAWNTEFPVLLEALSRLNHRQVQTDIAQEDPDLRVTIQYLLGRIEFVRREVMYELRYAGKYAYTATSLETETRVINSDKLAAAKADKVRLNLGCGHIPLSGYLNIDMREVSGIDILAEADRLPFAENEVDEIFSAHFLEHFPEEELRRQLLPYWCSLLKPGGLFRAVVPDGDAMIREFEKGRFAYKDLREALYGAQEYQGDFHFNLFTPESLSQLLSEAGFVHVDVVDAGRRNGSCFEFEIKAQRN